MRFKWIIPAAALGMAGCATIPPEERPSPVELSAACEITNEFSRTDLIHSQPEDGARNEQRLAELRKAVQWKRLPMVLRCPNGRRRMRSSSYGDFLDSIGLSSDGSIAGIAGGFQYAELLGGGIECYFERRDARWVKTGCFSTWAS